MSEEAPGNLPLQAVGSALPRVRRANRLPIYAAMGLVVISGAVIIFGLSSRGLYRGPADFPEDASRLPASDFGDRLKEGIPDGIIERPIAPLIAPPPAAPHVVPPAPFPTPPLIIDDWRQRLEREHQEQVLREVQRRELLSIQASLTALDSPISVAIARSGTQFGASIQTPQSSATPQNVSEVYEGADGGSFSDPDQQGAKQAFLEQEVSSETMLARPVVGQQTPYELKRGSIIPAVMLTGINSDLPGRIIAQVSQNVFDSASGHHLLIPQGSKLFGRYDSDVSFGQDRVLVVWTDLIFPDGDSLVLGTMAGTDSQGFGGFNDQVDRHYPEIFGAALLVAVFGAGVDLLSPEQEAGSRMEEAARGSFAESFGQVGSKTMDRNLDVQPTLTIRPGYVFNVIVEQDIRFPGAR